MRWSVPKAGCSTRCRHQTEMHSGRQLFSLTWMTNENRLWKLNCQTWSDPAVVTRPPPPHTLGRLLWSYPPRRAVIFSSIARHNKRVLIVILQNATDFECWKCSSGEILLDECSVRCVQDGFSYPQEHVCSTGVLFWKEDICRTVYKTSVKKIFQKSTSAQK